jgi:hypothetical protein
VPRLRIGSFGGTGGSGRSTWTLATPETKRWCPLAPWAPATPASPGVARTCHAFQHRGEAGVAGAQGTKGHHPSLSVVARVHVDLPEPPVPPNPPIDGWGTHPPRQKHPLLPTSRPERPGATRLFRLRARPGREGGPEGDGGGGGRTPRDRQGVGGGVGICACWGPWTRDAQRVPEKSSEIFLTAKIDKAVKKTVTPHRPCLQTGALIQNRGRWCIP